MGVPPENVVYLAERPELDPALIDGRSTKEDVTGTLGDLAGRAAPQATIFVVLIGHGSYQGDESRFSMPGPDMSAKDFAAALDQFATQQVVFVNTASASGDFVKELSAPNRTVITATKSPFERNETVFCEHFINAFSQDVADVDKDERVSILEAFDYARTEVARFFESEARLLTEHAVLDDNGDGVGSSEPNPESGDGALARTLFLDAGAPGAGELVTDDPELKALYERRDDLERQIATLRDRKDEMQSTAYENALEELLLDLARTSQAIREREKRGVRP
jgi:hypothetical protein